MITPIRISACAFAAISLFAPLAFTQTASPTENDALRVNVTINPDESRTVYEFDPPHHKATATTTERDGKLRGKIVYSYDSAGKQTGYSIFDASGKLIDRTSPPTGTPTSSAKPHKSRP